MAVSGEARSAEGQLRSSAQPQPEASEARRASGQAEDVGQKRGRPGASGNGSAAEGDSTRSVRRRFDEGPQVNAPSAGAVPPGRATARRGRRAHPINRRLCPDAATMREIWRSLAQPERRRKRGASATDAEAGGSSASRRRLDEGGAWAGADDPHATGSAGGGSGEGTSTDVRGTSVSRSRRVVRRSGAQRGTENGPGEGPAAAGEASTPMAECPICRDEKPASEFVACCGGGHETCQACVRQFVETAIGDFSSPVPIRVRCVAVHECQMCYTRQDLARSLGDDVTQRYNAAMDAMYRDDPAMAYCPCGIWNRAPQGSSRRTVMCSACGRHCPLPPPVRQEPAQAAPSADHAGDEIASRAVIRKCPGCRRPFIKDLTQHHRCNDMFCGFCRIHWCYVCEAKLGNSDDHFWEDVGHWCNCPGRRSVEGAGKCRSCGRCFVHYSNDNVADNRRIQQAKGGQEEEGVSQLPPRRQHWEPTRGSRLGMRCIIRVSRVEN
eukprot:evm.model.scf_468.7 EVM.evm.TU.scf_468.7   scf_468:43040-44827(-)